MHSYAAVDQQPTFLSDGRLRDRPYAQIIPDGNLTGTASEAKRPADCAFNDTSTALVSYWMPGQRLRSAQRFFTLSPDITLRCARHRKRDNLDERRRYVASEDEPNSLKNSGVFPLITLQSSADRLWRRPTSNVERPLCQLLIDRNEDRVSVHLAANRSSIPDRHHGSPSSRSRR